ncbi:MAG: cell division ATP-binding protein FtsE [Vicinamibacterales bacterium]
MIEALELSKLYPRGVVALTNVTLTIGKGEFVFLTGPSGAGKTTLLRLLLRQDTPSQGSLTVGGRALAQLTAKDVQEYRRTLGFVFQDFKLIPRKTVFENIGFMLRATGVAPTAIQRRVMSALLGVGLQHRAEAYPLELSGGEQQRIAIARALVNDPALVLADEPTGNLDRGRAREVMDLFREMNTRGTTVVVATHDPDLVKYVGRRAIALEDGRVVEAGA